MSRSSEAIEAIRRIMQAQGEVTVPDLHRHLKLSLSWLRKLVYRLHAVGVFTRRWSRVNGARAILYRDTGVPLPVVLIETDAAKAKRQEYNEKQRLSRIRERAVNEEQRKREQERIRKRKKRLRKPALKRFTVDLFCPACGELKLVVEPVEVANYDVKMNKTRWTCAGCGDFLYIGDCITFERLRHAFDCWNAGRRNNQDDG